MLPATKAIPKEMLPSGRQAAHSIYRQRVRCSGYHPTSYLVTHSSKNAIENHFDKSFELETTLDARVKRQELAEIQSITPKGVTIMHVRQGEAKGLGHAVLKARPLVGDEPFAVVPTGRYLRRSALRYDAATNLAQMLARYNDTKASQIMVEPVPEEKVSSYGNRRLQWLRACAG